ncbi:hypothetical protein B0H11DRAFT_18244 [Mycena galericulata]|nr:hypothetical protein B0H11DRAFT_18244 [Mycena galericulata]
MHTRFKFVLEPAPTRESQCSFTSHHGDPGSAVGLVFTMHCWPFLDGSRTYAVSRKSPMVLYILIVLSVVCSSVEFVSTFWKRVAFQTNANCTSGNLPGVKIASLYYVGCLVFDVVAMYITATYLWKFSNTNRASLSRLTRMMLEDGIMYFIALSAMNVMNLIFFQSRDTTLQSSGASLGFAVTMIFSSRFILNLSERAHDGVSGDHSHSSRTPATGGRRAANNHAIGGTDSDGPELVVTVVKNVITMRDLSPDDELARQVKGEQWGTEDGNSMA